MAKQGSTVSMHRDTAREQIVNNAMGSEDGHMHYKQTWYPELSALQQTWTSTCTTTDLVPCAQCLTSIHPPTHPPSPAAVAELTVRWTNHRYHHHHHRYPANRIVRSSVWTCACR